MRTTAIGRSLLFLAGAAPSHGDSLDARVVILPPACADRIDNDGDGYVDFPEDRGCRSRHGRSEEHWTRPRVRRPRRGPS